jgi:hypothetical protein
VIGRWLARWGFMGPPRLIDTKHRVWHIPGRDDAEILRHLLELAAVHPPTPEPVREWT